MPAPVIATPVYRDARTGVAFLIDAFGFERHAEYEDDDGNLVHVELTLGDAMIMPATAAQGEYGQLVSAVTDGGMPTCGFYVVVADTDAHHRRALDAGADILIEPRHREHGGVEYTCRDIGGHVWTFGNYDPWATTSQ